MAATETVLASGRNAVLGDVSGVLVTISGNGATYATSTGGLPIDLTSILAAASPFSAPINPSDVVGIQAISLSTNGFLPANFALGTPTYTDNGGATVRKNQSLATCPATVRLYGTGSANHAALAEVADGANTDVFTALLLIARNGTNVN